MATVLSTPHQPNFYPRSHVGNDKELEKLDVEDVISIHVPT